MKDNKILATAVAAIFGASVATADISLTDNLTLSGFVDGSYSNTDNGTTRTESLGIDQFEADLAFSGEAASAEVHLQSDGGNVTLEQAFASYDLGNGVTISGGKFLNLLGFEADEPTGTYQYSYAYTLGGNGGQVDAGRVYNNGIRASFGVEDVAIAVSAYDSLWGNAGADLDLAYDAQVIFSGVENLTVAVGYGEDDNSTGTAIAEAFNVWASYESGQVTVAAEYFDATDGAGADGDGYLLLANYTINDNAAITVRYSEQDKTGANVEKFTISPSYSFTDNLGALIEYSTGEYNGTDVDVFAIETTFTF